MASAAVERMYLVGLVWFGLVWFGVFKAFAASKQRIAIRSSVRSVARRLKNFWSMCFYSFAPYEYGLTMSASHRCSNFGLTIHLTVQQRLSQEFTCWDIWGLIYDLDQMPHLAG